MLSPFRQFPGDPRGPRHMYHVCQVAHFQPHPKNLNLTCRRNSSVDVTVGGARGTRYLHGTRV